jgi:hypothetical protein
MLTKYQEDSRVAIFDFSLLDEMIAGDTIASGTVSASPSGLTLGSVTNTTTAVKVPISGGTSGTKYTLTIDATTAQGSVIGERVTLLVL